MTERWLGHRDLCPLQWQEPCDCPCGDIACPGVNACRAPDCSLTRELFKTSQESGPEYLAEAGLTNEPEGAS